MELLQKIEDRGYPTDYLLSRIRGRRVAMITDWKPLIFGTTPLESLLSSRYRDFMSDVSSESEWRHLLREFRWVYLQMNRTLRDIFWPFFLYSELRTVFLCIRYRAANEKTKIERILTYSLLSKSFKKILIRSEDIYSTIEGVENSFLPLSLKFEGIKEIFVKDGLKGVEQRLTNSYLEYTVSLKLHHVIKIFFVRIIDSRNIITLYKYLRWNVEGEPYFIKGGSISVPKLREIMHKEDIFGVLSIIHKLTGIAVQEPDATSVETSLYRGMTHFLRRVGKELSGEGLIMDYLWRCSIEAMNLGILYHGRDIDRETINMELIK